MAFCASSFLFIHYVISHNDYPMFTSLVLILLVFLGVDTLQFLQYHGGIWYENINEWIESGGGA